jgi:hypothetical protein
MPKNSKPKTKDRAPLKPIVEQLPPSIGAAMSKETPNRQPSDCLDDTARLCSENFRKRHEHFFNRIVAEIDKAELLGCGDDLLLWDASLLGLAQRVRDHLARSGVQVVGKAN